MGDSFFARKYFDFFPLYMDWGSKDINGVGAQKWRRQGHEVVAEKHAAETQPWHGLEAVRI